MAKRKKDEVVQQFYEEQLKKDEKALAELDPEIAEQRRKLEKKRLKKQKKKDATPEELAANIDIKSILLQGNYLTEEDLKKGEEHAAKNDISLKESLLGTGLISKDILGQAIAEYVNLPYIDLNTKIPDRDQVLKLPESIAKKHLAVVADEPDNQVLIATALPGQQDLVNEVQKIFKDKTIVVGYSLLEDIKSVFKYYRKPLKTRFMEIIQSEDRIAAGIIEAIIEDALVYESSDIHLEPYEKDVMIRFRIDGVMQEVGRITKTHYMNILNWIKVQARLRIDEHFSAQDGSIRFKTKSGPIDLRVSIVPVLDGEKIVMRLLASYVGDLTLAELGMSYEHQKILMKAANNPYGMILVTGPTGSGKTTTLYAVLKNINNPEINITTIEDPVEYKIGGVNHIQVNTETNLTFARGLRSIVRQDPDVILVGEIRDRETAEIAINAALTGHLLLSTFHANDAPTSIPRLLDMGIEHFLLSSTLEVIVAQRLVRKICERCRYSMSVTLNDIDEYIPKPERFFSSNNVTIYKGKGCKTCSGTGYRGRLGIFEFVQNTREMQELILTNPSSQQIWKLARKQGTRSFFEDGLDKVRSGITTIEELVRVAHVPLE
ncbi:hypothetical protein GF362_04835 [Candidatus Dojkabacteria bacterium]|nr:hypothetical protein [Candidatus Dojkabacteria bacterium]